MLQYLLDEHLPGYRIPARRLSVGLWSIDPVTCELKIRYCRISYPKQTGNLVAMRDCDLSYDYRYILSSDGVEYLVFDCERSYVCGYIPGGGRCHVRLDCRSQPPPDINNHLI